MIPYLSSGFPSQGTPGGRDAPGSGRRGDRGESFARLVDVGQQEAQEHLFKIEQLQSKIADYESMTLDLERRLEEQALLCMRAENEAIVADKNWRMKFEDITKEVDAWKSRCQREAEKAESLRNHLNRTERELYGILQKKHQILRGAGATAAPASGSADTKEFELPVSHMFKSSDLGADPNSQGGQSKKFIDKRAVSHLNDFLGITK